jgi:FkbM family methyltransferase
VLSAIGTAARNGTLGVLRRIDGMLGTKLEEATLLGVKLALFVPNGVERLRFIALGLRFGTGRFKGPARARFRLRDGMVDITLPDLPAFQVLGEIYVLQQYRPAPGPAPETVLDIGANIGISALFYRQTYPDARIVCVEADPAMLDLLRENTRPLGVEIVHAAVAASSGEIEFFQSDESWSGSIVDGDGPSVRVPAVTLDELIERYDPDLVKVDIEGAEYDVFASSRRAATVHTVVGEIHSPRTDPRTVELLRAFSNAELDISEQGLVTLFRAVR